MKLRFIMRDGKKILQTHPGKFGDWQDVPLVLDQTAPTEPNEQDIEDLESGEYRLGLKTVSFSKCIHSKLGCHCRLS